MALNRSKTSQVFELRPFEFAKDDPLATEHETVAAWVEAAFKKTGPTHWYKDVALKSVRAGKAIMDSKPDAGRRLVLAAVEQARHWQRLDKEVRSQAKNNHERFNVHLLPGYGEVSSRYKSARVVIDALMRRSLPFESDDIKAILIWCSEIGPLSNYSCPIGSITRTLERFAAKNPVEGELADLFKQFASALRASGDKDVARFSTAVEQLVHGAAEPTSEKEDAPQSPRLPPPQPAAVGNPHVLVQLKKMLDIPAAAADGPTTILDPDGFSMFEDSPLRAEHELISVILDEALATGDVYTLKLDSMPTAQKALKRGPQEIGRMLVALAERYVHTLLHPNQAFIHHNVWQSRYAISEFADFVSHSKGELSRDGLFDYAMYLAMRPENENAVRKKKVLKLIAKVEQEAAAQPLSEGERYVLSLLRNSQIPGPLLGAQTEEIAPLNRLIGDGATFWLVPGEVWSDAVNEDLSKLPATMQRQWTNVIAHALSASASRPTAKWLKSAAALVKEIGADQVTDAITRWFPLVSQGRSVGKLGQYTGDTRGAADTINDENAVLLRGLVWICPTLPRHDELVRLIAAVGQSAYKKVPGVGPRAVKVANAAVYALSEIPTAEAVGQLAMLKVRVKFGTAQKEIEKAFTKAAEALGMAREEIEEIGVPSYGLESVGFREETFGDYRAELHVTGSNAELRWFDAKGKALKSVPAKVKTDHKDDLKELQQSLKDIQGMLPAQRDRIDSMFLTQKSWPIETWRERYLNHPLVGTIARRLIWSIDGAPALFVDDAPTDTAGKTIKHGRTAEVTLWHPVGRPVEEVMAWRSRFEELGITQPFKQAHREVYLLTDAERNTRTYSNRYAAHIIRQHQFNALCAARGWKNKLRLMVDDVYPPASRELPNWQLRAEFWIEGIGDNYGVDTNDSGTFLRLATDQVRFYRSDAATSYAHAGGGGYGRTAGRGEANVNDPLPLEQIPPLAFSEIMRDVDLFVGVASVGNDPTWQDGGPQGRYLTYWQDFSFGELSGTASTRREVLQRLVPRLKIADRCTFSDRFLEVRGQVRTYKIHLGSGNILMKPNDEYLCIVPDAKMRSQQDDVYLPFEGDATLSIILSKAFLLAADDKIKDSTITRQIGK